MSDLILVRDGLRQIDKGVRVVCDCCGKSSMAQNTSLHTRDRICQQIDDCLIRLKLTRNNLDKDKYIALRTIKRIDCELNKYDI